MFNKSLKEIGFPLKVLITLFLLIIGVGYITAAFALYESHRFADGDPALSIDDIIVTFYGDRKTTVLQVESLGSMKTYYKSDDDINKVLDWINSGSDRIAYEKIISPIFENSCVSCHSPRGSENSSPLTNFDEVIKYVQVSKGLTFLRLSTLSHTHLITHGLMFFLLSIIFLFSFIKDKWKVLLFIFSFVGIFGDVACWWLSKLSPAFAYGTIVFGSILGTTFLFYFFVPIYEMWFKKKK